MFKSTVLWQGGEDKDYAVHRIPGMIVTNKGTLIAYNEARTGTSDWARMDIFAQRSEDNANTFGERIYLAHGTETVKTVNNPVMMQDKTGRIHFLYCEDYSTNGGRVLRRYSDDDGITWSEPVDITYATRPEYRNAFAMGPGHGICKRDGTLLVPVWMVPKHYGSPMMDHGPSVLSVLYSKDNGNTWQCGDILHTTAEVICPNETVAAELSDGRVYFAIRCNCKYRAFAISETGYSNFTNYGADKRLADPICFGSAAAYNDGKNPYTLLFVNCESKGARTNVVVRASTDNGVSWKYRKVLAPDKGGYCEINADSNAGLIYVLYEDKFGVSDTLAVFDYDYLMSE